MKKSYPLTASLLVCASLLLGCSSDPVISDRDVLVAQNRGELHNMYAQMKTDRATVKSSSERAQNLDQYIVVVGEKIADNKEATILNDLQRDLSARTITELEQAKAKAFELQDYSEKVYLSLVLQLDTAINDKQTLVSKKQAEYDQLDVKQSVKKVALLNEMAAIIGGANGAAVLQRRDAYITGLYRSAEDSMQSKRFEDVVMYLNQLDIVSSEYPGAKDLRYKVIAAEYEEQFWDALGNGDKLKSFSMLARLTEIPQYLEKHDDVKAIAKELAALFIDDGDKQMTSSSIIAAYDAYSKANFIHNALGNLRDFNNSELQFLAIIDKKLKLAFESKNYLPAFGYLSILTEFQSDHPSIELYGQTLNNAMLEQATIKFVPSYLTDTKGHKQLSREVVFQVEKQLSVATKGHVKFIERALSSADFSPRKVLQKANPTAYYFFSGEILSASVTSSQKQIISEEEVLTSYLTVENPEYIIWSNLKRRQQENQAQPEMTMQIPVMKKVEVVKELVTKDARLAVSYRFATASGKVVLVDAVDELISVKAEGNKGIQEGLFTQEEKLVELPSDEVLYQQLANAAAAKIVALVKDNVEMLENRYALDAQEAALANNSNVAFENYVYDAMVMKSRGEAKAENLQQLRHYAIRFK